MKKLLLSLMTVFGLALAMAVPSLACTSYYVGPECTKDGSTLYGRTEDIGSAYDKVFKVIESKNVGPNAMYVDETGATGFTAPIYLEKTYRYTICRDSIDAGDGYFGEVGTNEKGVSMSATTSASPAKSTRTNDPYTENGITEQNLVDYILCQASTAREGVEILAKTIDTYGNGEGNGLFIADQKEVWYFEMLTGHTYCAIKLPKDKAALIPNCLVIGDVVLADKENVIASANLVSYAKDNNFFVPALEKGDINVKLSYTGEGYSAGNADRIRGGQYLMTGKTVDNTAIYTDAYQDIFFDCDDVTVEMLYEVAGYRYEGMDFGRDITREIGTPRSAECHILQIRKDMPVELGTVQWMCMNSADFSTFVPFYGAALTKTPNAYSLDAYKFNENSAYWIYRKVGALCATNRTMYGPAVKNFYKSYMVKMETLKKDVDAQMKMIYKNEPQNVEYYATKLSESISEQTLNYAKALYSELAYFNARYDGEPTKAFTTTLTVNDLVYDVSEIEGPKTVVPPKKPVTAPAKAVIKKVTNVKGKKLKVTLNKVTGAAGYEIACSTGVNFGKAKTKITTTKLTVKTVTKLKKGMRYYVKVRAYKMDGKKKVYGKWSSIKVVRVKK